MKLSNGTMKFEYGTRNIYMKTMGVWNAKILYRNVWNLSMVLYGTMSICMGKSIDFRTLV